jgi:hypothetical protein
MYSSVVAGRIASIIHCVSVHPALPVHARLRGSSSFLHATLSDENVGDSVPHRSQAVLGSRYISEQAVLKQHYRRGFFRPVRILLFTSRTTRAAKCGEW